MDIMLSDLIRNDKECDDMLIQFAQMEKFLDAKLNKTAKDLLYLKAIKRNIVKTTLFKVQIQSRLNVGYN